MIQTGTRMVVIVVEGDRFRPVAVQTGPEVDGRTEVLKGLKQGERVVVSGQFLIDRNRVSRTTPRGSMRAAWRRNPPHRTLIRASGESLRSP